MKKAKESKKLETFYFIARKTRMKKLGNDSIEIFQYIDIIYYNKKHQELLNG